MLPPAESLTVEFKSDRKRLSDSDPVEALVCLANTEGGEFWLGVEDDGRATGLHADHALLAGLVEDEALVVSNPGGLVDGVTLALSQHGCGHRAPTWR